MREHNYRGVQRVKEEIKSVLILSPLFFYNSADIFQLQNRLYPMTRHTAEMHTQKKLFGKIKTNVIPAPAENSIKPNTRFTQSPPVKKAPVYYIVCRRLCFIRFLSFIYFNLPDDLDGSSLYNLCMFSLPHRSVQTEQ